MECDTVDVLGLVGYPSGSIITRFSLIVRVLILNHIYNMLICMMSGSLSRSFMTPESIFYYHFYYHRHGNFIRTVHFKLLRVPSLTIFSPGYSKGRQIFLSQANPESESKEARPCHILHAAITIHSNRRYP